MVELPHLIKLSPVTLAFIKEDDRKRAGLSFELVDWKPALDPRYAVPETSNNRFDGTILPSYPVDAKLVLSNYFYISHREYLFGRSNNTLYAAYRVVDAEAQLFGVYMFEDLDRDGLIMPFLKGTWVMCEETGKMEAPWSVRVGPASVHNLL